MIWVKARIAILTTALAVVSQRLDVLLDEGVVTTAFSIEGGPKFVPEFVFRLVRTAADSERFEHLAVDHRPFFDRMLWEMEEHDPSLALHAVAPLRSLLTLPKRDTEEWTLQNRALHIRRALDLGYGLLKEIESEGLSPVPAWISHIHAGAVKEDEVPSRYKSRAGFLQDFADYLSMRGLDREARMLESIKAWKPSTHGALLFSRTW